MAIISAIMGRIAYDSRSNTKQNTFIGLTIIFCLISMFLFTEGIIRIDHLEGNSQNTITQPFRFDKK